MRTSGSSIFRTWEMEILRLLLRRGWRCSFCARVNGLEEFMSFTAKLGIANKNPLAPNSFVRHVSTLFGCSYQREWAQIPSNSMENKLALGNITPSGLSP